MMVAPKAPEGGWKKWFLEHPYQRTKYPILRAPDVAAVWQMEEGHEPPTTPRFEYVEMWCESKSRKVYASLNGEPPDWLWFGDNDSDRVWEAGVEDLFNHCIGKPAPTPPEPSGSGWDDFDWSK